MASPATDVTIAEALAFDDVLLEPSYSAVLPAATDTRTRLTRAIPLNIPLLSAAIVALELHRPRSSAAPPRSRRRSSAAASACSLTRRNARLAAEGTMVAR